MIDMKCENCGLPTDLCACSLFEQEEKRLRSIDATKLGIISPPRIYYCLKCGKELLQKSEIVTRTCPCCCATTDWHVGCGGRVVSRDLGNLPRIY
jgi:hypothetical protein